MKEDKAYIGDEIVEGNKSINEFMGLPGSHLKYHERWDYLMPVVKKINEWIYIPGNRVTRGGGISVDINLALRDIDINKTWKAVVEFITWYNNNQTKKQ